MKKRIIVLMSAILLLCLTIIPGFAETPIDTRVRIIYDDPIVERGNDLPYYMGSAEIGDNTIYTGIASKSSVGALTIRYNPKNLPNDIPPVFSYEFAVGLGESNKNDASVYRPRLKIGFLNGEILNKGDASSMVLKGNLGWTFGIDSYNGDCRIWQSAGLTSTDDQVHIKTIGNSFDYDVNLVQDIGDYRVVFCRVDITTNSITYPETTEALATLSCLDSYSGKYITVDTMGIIDADLKNFYKTVQVYDTVTPVDYYTGDANLIWHFFSEYYEYNSVSAAYEEGKRIGYAEGKRDGEDIGFDDGYKEGKRDGFLDGSKSAGMTLDIPAIFNSLFAGSATILTNAFGFEIFGINIAGLVISITVVGVLIIVYRKVK